MSCFYKIIMSFNILACTNDEEHIFLFNFKSNEVNWTN